jgi:hypothetical protein
MHQTVFRFIAVLMIVSFCLSPLAGTTGKVSAQDFTLPVLPIEMSADGLTLYNAVPPDIFWVDDSPEAQNIQDPQAGALVGPEAAYSTFTINYIAAEQNDPWGQVCVAFPEAAKASFTAAAAIWAARLKSTVPITINACWANLNSSTILGYAGGAPIHRDFTGAPKSGTWYQGALANSLAGSDLAPSTYDMNITYNKNFAWYYGTDGATPTGKVDLVSVAAHEIGHGLNFAGSAGYSAGSGGFGNTNPPYPDVYDTFMQSSTGKKLITYTNPSTALGSLLTSNSLWFSGPKAMISNGGARVKMYAPSSWEPGASYNHMDFNTFAYTSNNMMVPSIGYGSSRHTIGTVILGLLQDLGWQIHVPSPAIVMPANYITTTLPTFKWTPVKGATFYVLQVYQGSTYVYGLVVPASACSSVLCSKTSTTPLSYGSYLWQVKAKVAGTYSEYSRPQLFYVMPPGFSSTFTTTSSGWTSVYPVWALHRSGYFYSSGVPNQYASVKHNYDYPVLTYTVKMKRTGCAACANNLYFYGAPSPLNGFHEWNNTYKFAITNDGRFMVGKMVGGVYAAVVDWTASATIVQGGWNTLKVTAKDTFVQFFINNTRVASGNIYSFSNGRVGFGFYRDPVSTANKLYVDYATLTTTAPSAVVAAESEPGGIYFNEATGEGITTAPDVNPDLAP